MDEVTHEEVFSVYGRVLEAFARQGLRCEIIGGQALMQLGFTTWTKDLDLAVPPPALPQCLQVLEDGTGSLSAAKLRFAAMARRLPTFRQHRAGSGLHAFFPLR
jgi:hypothetical protein